MTYFFFRISVSRGDPQSSVDIFRSAGWGRHDLVDRGELVVVACQFKMIQFNSFDILDLLDKIDKISLNPLLLTLNTIN